MNLRRGTAGKPGQLADPRGRCGVAGADEDRGLISMEWRCWHACEDLLAMVRDVKECRFLVFFLVSECFGAVLLWAAAEVHSPASVPGTGGLSHSISCLAAELNSTYEIGNIPILSASIPSAQFSSTLRITVRTSSLANGRQSLSASLSFTSKS